MDQQWLQEEALPIVKQVARSLARGVWANDLDDLVQEGLLAVWREGVTDRGLVAVCSRRRMIDAQRRTYGRAGTRAYIEHGRRLSLDAPVTDDGTMTFANYAAMMEEEGFADVEAAAMMPEVSRMLEPREAEVLQRQARGELLREIGASWGLTEARVCQISMKARKTVAAVMQGTDP